MRSRIMARYGVVVFTLAIWSAFLGIHGALEYICSAWWPTQDDVPWGVEWARSTMENLQSEVFQVAFACVMVDQLVMRKRFFQAADE